MKTGFKTTITIVLSILATLLAVYCYNKVASSAFEDGYTIPIENPKNETEKIRNALLEAKVYLSDEEIKEILEIGDINKMDSSFNIGPTVKTTFD